jgi:hypothetical protein
VLAEGVVVGRIMKVHAAPVGSPWMWTLAFGQREIGRQDMATRQRARLRRRRSLRAGDGNRPALPLARPAGANFLGSAD